MIIIEYIQLVFVVCGMLIIIAILLMAANRQLRKYQLYAKVIKLLNYKKHQKGRHSIEQTVWSAEFSRKEAEILLSRINTTDIATDAFLKEVVDTLLQRFFISENNKENKSNDF